MIARLRNECGQTLVFGVLAMSGFMGMSALVLDVGSWFRAQRNMQAVADAAALAGAQYLPDNPGGAIAGAQTYATKNGFTLAVGEITISTRVRANDTIRVHASQRAPGFFSKVLGIDGANVGAVARATSSNLGEARYIAPIAVDYQHDLLHCTGGGHPTCSPTFGVPTTLDLINLHGNGSGSGAGNFGLVDLNNTNGSASTGDIADWVEYGYDRALPLGNYDGAPSTKYHSSQVREALDLRMGSVLLFPVYDRITGPGSNAKYHVIGWVGFRITGFTTSSQNGTLTGSFVRFVAQGIESVDPGQPEFGLKKITLVE